MTKKLLALSLIVALIGLPFPVVRADDTDIFGTDVQPNVLIAIDNSGSMGDQIYSAPYDPTQTYAGSSTCSPACVATTVYKQTSTTTRHGQTTTTYTVYATSISAVNSSSARTALSTTGYWSGTIGGSSYNLYLGDYLNWQASPGATLVVKMTVAQQVLTNIVNSTQGVRFGLMTFANNSRQGQGGGQILAPMGSSTSTITTAINSLQANGYTPDGEMLNNAGTYYAGKGDYYGKYATSPVQLSCQPNFVILMSDGLQNGNLDMRTVATTLHTSAQKIIVDTVGFAVTPGEEAANDIMQTTATNGGGTFYSTNNQATLEAALEAAISQIMVATFTFATPVIPTTQTSSTNRVYMAAFESNLSLPFWDGYLKAYNLNSTGNVPVDSNGVPLASALAWEAGAVLHNLGSSGRNIYTYLGRSSGSLTSFTTSLSTSVLSPAMVGLSAQADRDNLINFLWGKDSYNWFGNGTTVDRPWILGDIFHSTPVLVSPPFLASTDSTYAAFAAANAGRTTILLAGANDGMLHAFRESDGTELWAFIPPNLFPYLQQLTVVGGGHQWFVDGSPVAADVKVQMQSAYVTDPAAKWRTIVIVGERRGGNYYYALDITNTGSAPTLLWSFTDPDMGETYSTPSIGTVMMADGTTKYVAFMGGGYEEAHDNSLGKAVFAIDIATGSKLWEYKNASGATDDRKYMNFSIPADITAVDFNNNGFIDRLYIGDVGGQVWTFDVVGRDASGNPTGTTLSTNSSSGVPVGQVSNWLGKRLFTADATADNPPNNPPPAGEYYPTQGIWDAIVPAYDQQNHVWIYFGTGDRDHPDYPDPVLNEFYGIEDPVDISKATDMTNGSAITVANLVNVTSNNGTPIQGWYMTLGTNEKVLSTANVFNYIVYFSTFTPTSTTTCGSGGGNANLYAVQMVTGYAALAWSNSGAPLTTTNASVTRSTNIGTGIPSKPVIMITASGTSVSASVITATTSQQLTSNPAPPPSAMRQVLYWREVF
jgi:type IV pilus assembly protein PilY1